MTITADAAWWSTQVCAVMWVIPPPTCRAWGQVASAEIAAASFPGPSFITCELVREDVRLEECGLECVCWDTRGRRNGMVAGLLQSLW